MRDDDGLGQQAVTADENPYHVVEDQSSMFQISVHAHA